MPKSNAGELRARMRALVEASGLTQRECAVLIQEQAGRPCPERTLRTWLADPESVSARNPQEWAVAALEAVLAKQKKRKKRA